MAIHFASAGDAAVIIDDAAAAVTTNPVDGDSGVAIPNARGASPVQHLVEIWRSTGTGDTTLTGPVEVYVFDGTTWFLHLTLSTGNVTFSEVGVSYRVAYLGGYTRIAIKSGALSAGSFTVRLREIRERS